MFHNEKNSHSIKFKKNYSPSIEFAHLSYQTNITFINRKERRMERKNLI